MAKLIKVQINNFTGIKMHLLFKRTDIKGSFLNFSSKDNMPSSWKKFKNGKSNFKLEKGKGNCFYFFMEEGQSGTLYFSPHPIEKKRPHYKTSVLLFDQIEVSFSSFENSRSDFLGEWKISNDSFFGLPMQLESRGEKIGFNDYVTRESMMKRFLEMSTPYDNLQMPKRSHNINRWLSPASKELGNYWNEAISLGLKKLSGQSFFYQTSEERIECFFKKATNDSIEIREAQTSEDTRKDCKFIIRNINTIAAIRGTLFPDFIKIKSGRKYIDSEVENITIKSGAFLAAAINRGVLYDTSLWKKEDGNHSEKANENYYKSSEENKGQFNFYAKTLHEHSINNQCFGFCYDQFFEQGSILNAYKSIQDKPDVKISLLPFK